MPKKLTPLEQAIAHFDGKKSKLAKALDVSPMTVQHWVRRKRVPPEHAPRIEKACGGAVTKEQLRPDIFTA